MDILIINYLSLKVCPTVADLTSVLMGFELYPAHSSMHIKGKEKKIHKGTINAVFRTPLIPRFGKVSQA